MTESGRSRAWVQAMGRIATLLIAGVLSGLILGRVWLGLSLALLFALAWNLFNLYRLDGWLRDRSRDAPDAWGVWGDVMLQVVRLHRRKRFHKQRLLQVFREIRHSTAAMPDGVVVLNERAEILWFNRMAARLLQLKGRRDLGLHIGNLLRQPEFLRYLQAAQFDSPLIVDASAGDSRSLSFQIVPYGADQQLVLVRDVTRQVQLESLRRDFVANASHELRSPLTVVSGYLETIEQDPMLDEALRGPLQEMRRQTDRMTAIVHDLLELSRLDASTPQNEGEVVDVAALAAQLGKDVLARPDAPGLTLHLETAAALQGNEQELHSAFANLVDNAAKYTARDGHIDVRWWLTSLGEACFTVQDTGVGIAAHHLSRLTERFYRVDDGRSRVTGGSGLGLAIVKHVLQHHGAQLDIQSTPGKGSVFTCRFPPQRVLMAAQGSTIQPGPSAPPEDVHGYRGSLAPHLAPVQRGP